MDLYLIQGAAGSGKTKVMEAITHANAYIVVVGCDGLFRGDQMNPDDKFDASELRAHPEVSALIIDSLYNTHELSHDDLNTITSHKFKTICIASSSIKLYAPRQLIEHADNVFEMTMTRTRCRANDRLQGLLNRGAEREASRASA